jgi:O-antigen/teichoic acid export membrane protein
MTRADMIGYTTTLDEKREDEMPQRGSAACFRRSPCDASALTSSSPADPVSLSPSAVSSPSVSRLSRPLAALIDQAVVSGTSFLVTVLVGRFAGEQQLGLYSLGFTLIILACGVQESLVVIPYTVFAPRAAAKRRTRFAGSALLQSVVASLAMSGCLAVAGLALTAPRLPQFAPVVAVLLAAVPMILLREFARRFAFAQMRFATALAIDGAVTAAQLTVLFTLAASGKLSAAAALAIHGGCCGVVGLGWFFIFRRHFSLARDEIAVDWRQSWGLGSWLLAGHVTGITQAYALHWCLAFVLGAETTGGFAAAMTIVSLANPFILGAGNLLMPVTAHTFANSGSAGVWRLAVRSTRWLAAGLTLFSLSAAFAGDRALAIVYGGQFGGQIPTVTLLALAISVAALGLSAEHGLRASDRPRAIFAANFLALIVTLGLAACLVPTYRNLGAAASLLAGNLVGSSMRWWAFRFWVLDRQEQA